MKNIIKNSIYWKTLKQIDRRWIFILILIILFFFAIYGGLRLLDKTVEKLDLEGLIEKKELMIQNINTAMLEEAEQLTQQIYQNITLLAVYIFAFIFFIIISYSIFNYFIYKQVYKNRYKTKNLLKYLAFNLVFGIVITFANIQGFKIIKPNIAPLILIIELILLTCLLTFFNLFFFKQEKVFRSIKLVYFLTISKLHRLLPAFGWVILTFILLSIPFFIINIFIPALWLFLIPLLLSLTFNRYYLKNVLESKNIKSVFKN